MKKLQLLNEFQAKAGCMHSQRKATKLWRELYPYLTRKEMIAISSAWGHHTFIHLGRGELDWVCEEIKKDWTSNGLESNVCRMLTLRIGK